MANFVNISMTFAKLYSLVTEGVFELPQYVFKDILDYFNRMAKAAKESGAKRITEKSFPIRNFPINLKGTNYEFLIGALAPYTKGKGLTLNVSLTMNPDQVFYHNWHVSTKKNTFAEDLTGNIQLCLTHVQSTNFHVLEHEVLHYIQELLKKYKQVSGYKDQEIGGLPSFGVLPMDRDVDGYLKKDASARRTRFRRVNHSNRPTEYYTDLLSALRELQITYESERRVHGTGKKEFFEMFLSDIKRNKSVGDVSPMATSVFKSIRNSNYELYKVLLKKIYSSFMNGYPNFDFDEIKKEVREVKEIGHRKAEEAAQKKMEMPYEERIFNNLSPFQVRYHDTPDYSNLDDGNYAFSEEAFDRLPHTKRRESRDDGEYYSMSMKWKHLQAIFKKIQEMYRNEDDPEHKENYIYFAKELLKDIMKHAEYKTNSLGFDKAKQIEIAKKLFNQES